MESRVELDWRVPAAVWDNFVEQTMEKYGDIPHYITRDAELALEEAIGWDGGEATEDLVNRLVSAAGRRPRDTGEKKISSEALEGEETVRVRVKVHPELKEAYSAYMKEHSEHRLGVAFAHTLLEWLDSSRVERIKRKIERVVEDATGLLSEVAGSVSGSGPLSTIEKRTIAFCQQLRERLGEKLERNLHRETLRSLIGERFTSESTIDQYEEAIRERLGLVEHPENPQLYVPKERRRELIRKQAEAEMDAQTQAQVATDGGRDRPGPGSG